MKVTKTIDVSDVPDESLDAIRDLIKESPETLKAMRADAVTIASYKKAHEFAETAMNKVVEILDADLNHLRPSDMARGIRHLAAEHNIIIKKR